MQVAKVGQTKIIFNKLFLLLLFFWTILGLLHQACLTFAIIICHELAHMLVAQKNGLQVKEVEILPFGGVARLEGLMEVNPWVEIKIALAGPIANLFLALVVLFLDRGGEFSLFFIQGNLFLAAFNLLPALPLDGGRIWRAFLAYRIGYNKATEKAVALAKMMASLLFIIGTLGVYCGYDTYSLLILGPFIYSCARREKEMAGYAFIFSLQKKKEKMQHCSVYPSEKIVVAEETPVREVVKYFLPNKYYLIFVLNREMQLTGIISEGEILDALLTKGAQLILRDLLP